MAKIENRKKKHIDERRQLLIENEIERKSVAKSNCLWSDWIVWCGSQKEIDGKQFQRV